MSNDNYMVALRGFVAGATPLCFKSAGPADFNALTPNGNFGASVTAVIRGEFANVVVEGQYLWGNRDPDDPNRGWSIQIEDDGAGQAQITGYIGRGAGVVSVSHVLTGVGTIAWAERAIQIGLYLANDELPRQAVLTINGQVVTFADVATNYAPSMLPVSLGCSPNLPSTIACRAVDVVAAYYAYNTEFGNVTSVGQWASRAFAAERASNGGGVLDADFGVDWVHRYSVRQLAQGAVSTIQKLPASAGLVTQNLPRPNGYAYIPGTFADSGNQIAATDPDLIGDEVIPVSYSPVALLAQGPDFVPGIKPFPYIVGRKNVDWYQGGAYSFPVE